jgi:membrane protease YdiL (CAAX protease family)
VTAPATPERPWSALWALVIALGALVAGGIVSAVAIAIRNAATTPPVHQAGVVGVALHGVPPVVTCAGTLAQDLALVGGAVLVAAAAAGGRVSLGQFGLRPAARAGVAAGLVAAGYLLFLVLSAAWSSALHITDHESVPIELGTRDSSLALLGAGLLVCVIAPVCEELFFRGFLFGALRRYGLVVATLMTGLAFGAAHVASAPLGFIVPLAALGMILCLVYERTGSLYPGMALHALNNAIAFGIGDGRVWLIPAGLGAAALAIFGLSRSLGGDRSLHTAVSTP